MTASIITFYSFKGGVGRTQAIANVAVSLARKGYDIVVVDMDLESPGLHTYFAPDDEQEWSDEALVHTPGVLDFLEQAAQIPEQEPSLAPYLRPCVHRQLHQDSGSIRLLLPGRLDSSYANRVASFSWERFYEARLGYEFVEVMRRQLVESGADFVLLDSRTGTTEVAGICTFQLPDVVVAMTAPHRQGIEGIGFVAKKIAEARTSGATKRVRELVLLLSRVEEDSELDLREYWVRRARQYIGDINATILFDQHQRIPYEARAAFGEPIVVGNPTSSYLADAYERLSECLLQRTGKSVRNERALSGDRLSENRPAVTAAAAQRIRRHVASAQAELRTLIERELRVIHDELSPCYQQHERLVIPEELQRGPRSLTECERFAHDVDAQLGSAWRNWREAWEQRFHEALLLAAEGDRAAVKEQLVKLRPFLQTSDIAGAQAQLEILIERVRHGSRNALLKNNELERDRLQRSISDRQERVMWLTEKLDQAVQVELAKNRSEPETALAMIRNCLRLLILDSEVKPRHWVSYESLCGYTDKESSAYGDDFETIGEHLWITGWREFLEADVPTAPADALPIGKHMREQLRWSMQDEERQQRLGSVIARGIVDAWRRWRTQRGCVATLTALFRDWGDDPALLWALGNLPSDANAADQRALTAVFLRAGQFERQVATHFLFTLIQDGYPAEAFLARAAMAKDGQDVGERSLSLVASAVVVAAIVTNDVQALRELIDEPQCRAALGQDDGVGRVVLIALAGCFFRRSLIDAPHRRQLLADILYSKEIYLPQACRDWLDWLVARTDWEPDTAEQIVYLEQVCRESILNFPIFNKWDPSHEYKRLFEEYWNGDVERIRNGTMLNDKLADQEYTRWVRHAEQDVKKRFTRNTRPNAKWNERMQESFKATQASMRTLRNFLRKNNIDASHWHQGKLLHDACRDDLLTTLSTSQDEYSASKLAIALRVGRDSDEVA